ncbi:MAG: PaaI family thioesterase [Acidobacteria bacterium]|nr:PaaI family thioesterase [Acidobacteriota bacterium]
MAGFNESLGLVHQADGSVLLETQPEHEVAPGTIHFAVLTTIAEVSAARAVGQPVVPAAIDVQLMRRARPGRLVGVGRALKVGRSLAFADGEVRQEGEIVARATVTFARL